MHGCSHANLAMTGKEERGRDKRREGEREVQKERGKEREEQAQYTPGWMMR